MSYQRALLLALLASALPGLSQAQYYGNSSRNSNNANAQYEREREREKERERERERDRERERQREAERERERQAAAREKEHEREQAREKERREQQATREREQREKEQRERLEREHAAQQRAQSTAAARDSRRDAATATHSAPPSAPTTAHRASALPPVVNGSIADPNRRPGLSDPTTSGRPTSLAAGQASQPGAHTAFPAPAGPAGTSIARPINAQPGAVTHNAAPPTPSAPAPGTGTNPGNAVDNQAIGRPRQLPPGVNGTIAEIDRKRPVAPSSTPLYTPPPVTVAPPARPLAPPSSVFGGRENEPVQRGYGDNAYRPAGTPARVDPSRTSTFQSLNFVNQGSAPTAAAGASSTAAKPVATSGNAATNSATSTASDKKAGRQEFKKQPMTVPTGVVAESLTKPNGEYNCAPVNAYASKYDKDSGEAWHRYLDAPYHSEERCSALCDTLAWREELVSRFNYTGSWSCSSRAVGMWGAFGSQFRSYRNGNNSDRCTCVGSNGAPYPFTEASK